MSWWSLGLDKMDSETCHKFSYLRADETPLVVSLACLQANAATLGAANRMAYAPVMSLSTHLR
jgi:hypothetical protein